MRCLFGKSQKKVEIPEKKKKISMAKIFILFIVKVLYYVTVQKKCHKSFFFFLGRPQPKVTWWSNGAEITGMSHPSADEGLSAMINQLFIGTITREYFGTKLECRAQSSKLLPVVTKEISIQVYCK